MDKTHRSTECIHTKMGCLTCRQRRKKCDEIKPVCAGCARNFINCKWPVSLVASKVSKQWRWSPVSVTRKEMEKQSASRRSTSVGRNTRTSGLREITFVFDKYSSPPAVHEAPAPSTTSVIDVEPPNDDGDERPESIIVWQPLTASFISAERVLLLNPSSFLLLQHYMEATSTFMVAKPLSSNPFINLVLPLAYSDDLLMHAVLVLSGTHLSFKSRDELKIQWATRQHYSLLLRTLRCLFADESTHGDIQRTLRLLLVLVVLCHAEAIPGEPHGGIFPHLRARRELVLKLLQEPHQKVHNDIKVVKGFALEVYFYLVLVNSITPYGRDEARVLPLDSCFSSLKSLKEYETFGVFFSCGEGLFEMIPQVSVLAMRSLTEEESGSINAETRSTYESLIHTISGWQSPQVASEMVEWEQEHIWIGEIYRQALLIFLKVSMCGSVVKNPKVIVAIQHHIDIAFPLFMPVYKSPFITILLWPIMIIGSCLICEDQRREYLRFLYSDTKINISQVGQAAKIIEHLWRDEDERACGSFGLHLVMRKHRINFSMA